MLTALKSRTVGAVRKIEQVDEVLAERAQSLLGYSALGLSVAAIQQGAQLKQALHDLGVSILHPLSVVKYKREKREQARKQFGATTRGWHRYSWAWVSVTLRKYQKTVPPSAIALAVKIAEVCPTAEFYVEELRRHRKVVDPFLYVRAGTTKYYIAHWDEPTFSE